MSCLGCGQQRKSVLHSKPYNLLHVIKDEITGKAEYVKDDLYNQRLSFCNVCQHLFGMTRQCKKCGCFIDVKARYSRAFCPIGKWNSDEQN